MLQTHMLDHFLSGELDLVIEVIVLESIAKSMQRREQVASLKRGM